MSTANFYLSKDKREELPLKVFGYPKKRLFPILSENDVMAAAKLLGRAKVSEDERRTIKRRIINIALRENYKIPDAWAEDGTTASDFSNNTVVSWENQRGGISFGVIKELDGDSAVIELCNKVDGEIVGTGLTFNCDTYLLDFCD